MVNIRATATFPVSDAPNKSISVAFHGLNFELGTTNLAYVPPPSPKATVGGGAIAGGAVGGIALGVLLGLLVGWLFLKRKSNKGGKTEGKEHLNGVDRKSVV